MLGEKACPAYARALGYRVADNGFHPGEASDANLWHFNRVRSSMEPGTIAEELARPWGRRVFHPVTYVLPAI